MQGGQVRKIEADFPEDDPEAQWHDWRTFPVDRVGKFLGPRPPETLPIDQRGGTKWDPPSQELGLEAIQRQAGYRDPTRQEQWGEGQVPITGLAPVPPLEVGATIHMDTSVYSPSATPEGMIKGDPTRYLEPGTSEWREKQAVDQADELTKQAESLEKKWGIPVTDDLDQITADLLLPMQDPTASEYISHLKTRNALWNEKLAGRQRQQESIEPAKDAKLTELRRKQIEIDSVNKWFADNGDQSGLPMPEEAEQFLREMVDANAKELDSAQRNMPNEPYDPAKLPDLEGIAIQKTYWNDDVLSRLWLRDGAAHRSNDEYKLDLDRAWNRLTPEQKESVKGIRSFVRGKTTYGEGYFDSAEFTPDTEPGGAPQLGIGIERGHGKVQDYTIDRRSPDVAYRAWKKAVETELRGMSNEELAKKLGPYAPMSDYPDEFGMNWALQMEREAAFNEANSRLDVMLKGLDHWSTKPG
tara:strand:- start:548 stop:1957 length:1410 start_codon:yes stop_codon:yes gene_type:complete